MNNQYRLLVTGSREWDHPESVDAVLSHYTRLAFAGGSTLLVVHGKARKGLDAMAATWVHQHQRAGWPVAQEAHPANWHAPCVPQCRPGHRKRYDDGSDHCPYAGFRRNQEMVDAGALACIGFHRRGSSGTRDCLRRAAEARIPHLRITWQERETAADPLWLAVHTPGW